MYDIIEAIIEARFDLIYSDQHQFIWRVAGHRFNFGTMVPAGVLAEFKVSHDGVDNLVREAA